MASVSIPNPNVCSNTSTIKEFSLKCSSHSSGTVARVELRRGTYNGVVYFWTRVTEDGHNKAAPLFRASGEYLKVTLNGVLASGISWEDGNTYCTKGIGNNPNEMQNTLTFSAAVYDCASQLRSGSGSANVLL